MLCFSFTSSLSVAFISVLGKWNGCESHQDVVFVGVYSCLRCLFFDYIRGVHTHTTNSSVSANDLPGPYILKTLIPNNLEKLSMRPLNQDCFMQKTAYGTQQTHTKHSFFWFSISHLPLLAFFLSLSLSLFISVYIFAQVQNRYFWTQNVNLKANIPIFMYTHLATGAANEWASCGARWKGPTTPTRTKSIKY